MEYIVFNVISPLFLNEISYPYLQKNDIGNRFFLELSGLMNCRKLLDEDNVNVRVL